MQEKPKKRFLRAADIAAEFECSEAYAYKVIRELNEELQKAGFLTARGRVPAEYFYKRYGSEDKL